MASRHRSRELAVQMSYQWELDPKSVLDPKVIDRFWAEQAQSSDDNREFFALLVRGLSENLIKIDAAIEGVLQNWRMGRIEKVDLAVLRVSVYELLFATEKLDQAIVINEAVELAKKFGSRESPAFVNGILDALANARPKA